MNNTKTHKGEGFKTYGL